MTDDDRTPETERPSVPEEGRQRGSEEHASSEPTAETAPAEGVPPAEGAEPPEGADAPKGKSKGKGSFARELPVLLLIAFGLALIIKAFLVQAFFIPSGSMETTLHGCPGCTGDRVLVNKLVYDFRDPQRGEIIVFNGENSFDEQQVILPPKNTADKVQRGVSSFLGLGSYNETDYIKRVIALPGDTIVCCTDGKISITPKGSTTPVVLEEPYIFEDSPLTGTPCQGREFGPLTVPQGRLWVMGDHRSESADSRCHLGQEGNGTVPIDRVIGKAFVVVFPFDRIKLLPTPGTFDAPGLQASATAVPPLAAGAPYALGLAAVAPVGLVRARRRRR